MPKTYKTISVQELHDKINAGDSINLIDVRTPAEFESVHIQAARCIPLNTLNPGKISEHSTQQPDAPVYIICKSGQRSKQACEQLLTSYPERTILVEGGTDAWVSAGFPVERGSFILPLNQQVQAVIGTVVLLGVVLALLVNNYFILISLFAACGFIIGNLTGFCPLAILMAKMPWNRLPNVSNCSINKK